MHVDSEVNFLMQLMFSREIPFYISLPRINIKCRFLFSSHFCVTSANNAFKGTDRSPRCQRLGATYRLKCLLSVADATRKMRTSSRCRHVVSSKASATGNFANARRCIVNGTLLFSFSFTSFSITRLFHKFILCSFVCYNTYIDKVIIRN